MKIKKKNAKKVSGKRLSKKELEGVSGGVTGARRKKVVRKATKARGKRIL